MNGAFLKRDGFLLANGVVVEDFIGTDEDAEEAAGRV